MNTFYRIKKVIENHSLLLLIGLFLAGVATAILVFKILQLHL